MADPGIQLEGDASCSFPQSALLHPFYVNLCVLLKLLKGKKRRFPLIYWCLFDFLTYHPDEKLANKISGVSLEYVSPYLHRSAYGRIVAGSSDAKISESSELNSEDR